MPRSFRRYMRYFVRTFWATVLLTVISVAVCVQIGRMVFPYLNDYRLDIARQLENRLGVAVTIDSIESQWRGLRPRIILLGLGMASKEGQSIIFVDRVEVEVSLLAALRDWQDGIRTLKFDGLRASFTQDSDGQWRVHGLPKTTAAKGNLIIDDPLDIFLFGRRVELLRTELAVEFRNELRTNINIPRILLENDNQFHRLVASFSVDDHQALRLVLEGSGDPREEKTFESSGYLQLSNFPTEKVLEALSGVKLVDRLTRESPPGEADWADQGRLSMQLWFSGTLQKGMSFTGHATHDGVPIVPPAGAQWPHRVSSRFTGQWQRNQDWRLGLQNLSVQWPDGALPLISARIHGGPDTAPELRLPALDLAEVFALLNANGWLQHAALEPLRELQPKGILRNAVVKFVEPEAGYLHLRAELANGAVSAWSGVPAISGVQGFVEATAFSGQFDLGVSNGIALDFPKLYGRPLEFDSASGSVRWAIDLEREWVGVGSGPLQVANSGVRAQGAFNLSLPLKPETNNEPQMTLMLGVEHADALLYRQYLPNVVPTEVETWLNGAVQAGRVRDLGFIYHGTLMKGSKAPRTVQLRSGLAEAQVRFDKEWPVLALEKGSLWLDGEELHIRQVQGKLHNLALGNLQVVMPAVSSPQQRHLSIRGNVSGNSHDARALLLDSPLKRILGDELLSWQLQGNISAAVRLRVPLVEGGEQDQQFALYLRKNSLSMPSLNLDFEDLSGELTYSTSAGIHSGGLEARLWGEPLKVSMTSQKPADQPQGHLAQIDFRGQLEIDDLQKWLNRPELVFAEGSSDLSGRITVPVGFSRPLVFEAATDLRGVGLALPVPYYKSRDEKLETLVRVVVEPQPDGEGSQSDYRITFGEIAEVRLHRVGEQVEGVELALNSGANRPAPGVVLVHGEVDHANLNEWLTALDIYTSASENLGQSPDGEQAPAALPVRVELSVKSLLAGGMTLANMSIVGRQLDAGWNFDLNNDNLAGKVALAVADKPLAVSLDYLRLPATGGDAGEVLSEPEELPASALSEIDIRELPPVDFRTAEFSVGGANYGQWSFKLRPVSGGVAAYDLTGQVRGLGIGGRGERTAELLWLKSVDTEYSYFSGAISAADLGQVLTDWGQDKIITSDRAAVDLEVQWRGAPDQFQLANLTGMVNLDIDRGRFIRGASVGENPLLKLIGLLNFDTIARRLRLDFSDLKTEGMGYESIEGQLLFKEGMVTTANPIQVESPSANMQFAGDINIRDQSLNAQLVATLPVAGNLTVAAALAGGVPIAVGVYVAGKLFKNQVDKVSSIRYRIRGDWNNPEAKIEKVFENKTD